MSHPNPLHDAENVYPSDDYKPVSKKKKSIAKKMRPSIMEKVGELKRLVGESERMRRSPFFRYSQGGGGLPPGRTDKDNE